MRIVNLGLLLQLIFISFYLFQIRTFVLQRFGIYAVAYIELVLTIGSLILGIIAIIFRIWTKRTIFVISFGVLMCLWFIVIYLLPESDIPPIQMNLPNEKSFKNQVILRAEEVTGIVEERILWKTANFYMRGGDKLAVIGSNGSGKTTLIKKIINQEAGITISPSIKIGYFAQNLNILANAKTILENVQSTSNHNETLVRTVLARMHFFNEDVYKPVNVLSGGERVKVALTKVFLSDVNTLVLDEPTNYLDVESLEALETLLNEYEGTIIFVSHDRQFIKNIATRILEIQNKELTFFEGTYKQYKTHQSEEKRDLQQDASLLLETKISEVLSRLSVEPSEELEREFQELMKEKRKLEK